MSKLAAVVPSILGGLVVGGGVVYALWCQPPTPNDGNPIGFRLTGSVTLIGPTPSTTALQSCAASKKCTVMIDLKLPPKTATKPTPSASCAPNDTCLQFTGGTNVNSVDWNGNPHPAAPPPEAIANSSGTISISK